ncbi:potassium channel family protein [Guptibacillus hwajinpoensis]|uniref:Voltage-gated potassium channel n=1 Tax=Guptibacillus hwajinpoensis TaxID=208199 RepID=A0ABU0JVC3_9BACL|nr:potassium channel family protein [Alkalihalobacillus hemicentroti]MDQ0481057.1 voltage-gated potassium channel [Alkalihalobacillus hemicentroti]
MRLRNLVYYISRYPPILQLGVLTAFILISMGFIMHLVEPDMFPTVFDGVWFAIVTASTIGYGDASPESVKGKAVAIVFIMFGAGFMTFYMAKLASTFVIKQGAIGRGERGYARSNHVVIVGWNSRSRHTIKDLLANQPERSIVLIDHSLTENPLQKEGIHFVKGNPGEDRTLKSANVREAHTVLITADQYKSELEVDMQTILTLLTVKGINPTVYTIVEILSPEQIVNAERAGADEIIESAHLLSTVMTNSVFSHGISTTLLEMLTHLKPNQIDFMSAEAFSDDSFCDVAQSLNEKDILMIGVKRGKELVMNPSPSFIIQSDDYLLVIHT